MSDSQLWYDTAMLTLTRTTQTIEFKGKTLSHSFTQVLPIHTAHPVEDAMEALLTNQVIKNKTAWFSSDDWNSDSSKYFPENAGKYEYKFVESPNTEKHLMILVNTGFDNYFNDEYTRSGDCEFFVGPFLERQHAQESMRQLMDDFVGDWWSSDHHDEPLTDECDYSCEGEYTHMKIVEVDVMI